MSTISSRTQHILPVFYFVVYLAVGAFQFLNLFYKGIGFSSGEIGILFAIGPFMMVIGQPFWGYISDRFDAPKVVIVSLLSGSTIVALCFLLTHNFFIFLILNVLYSFFQSSINPIIDSTALKLLPDKHGYGTVRAWGALGYAISVLIVGWLLGLVGLQALFIIHAALLVIAIFIALQLPINKGKRIQFNWKEATALFKSLPYVMFLIFNFLLQLTISTNNSFYSIFLKQFGVGVTMVGVALLIKSILEVPFFGASKFFLNRFSFRSLFAMVALVYALRFFILGFSTAPWLMILSQVLLSFSFSISQFTGVVFVDRIMPDSYKSTGQTLYWATSYGLAGIAGNGLAAWFLSHYSISEMYRWIALIALASGILIWFSIGKKHSAAQRLTKSGQVSQ